MLTSNPNAPEVLSEDILAEARREAEEIVRHARQEAEAMLAKAQAEADKNRETRLALAQAEARQRRGMLLATVPTETGQLRAAAIERLLQSIRDEAQEQLLARDGFNYPGTLVALVAEAVPQMAGAAFVVKLGAADYAAFGRTVATRLRQRLPQTAIFVTADSAMTGSGVVIEGDDGRQIWDNRFSARLARLWPELRRQIAVQTGQVPASGPTGCAK